MPPCALLQMAMTIPFSYYNVLRCELSRQEDFFPMTLLALYLAGRLVWRAAFRNGPRCHSKIATNVRNTIAITHTMMTDKVLASVTRGDARCAGAFGAVTAIVDG